ncbi:MAG: glycosyltransferase family 39 protein [Saprospiraceae bacterium]|nr:glycosyltransferase family 39 protein [Saprospiraceae bacterium]
MGLRQIKNSRIPEKLDPWIIALLGCLFFLPGIGQVHLFDWDEINFAECAREMIESGNYLRVQINFQPFWEKPPLFFWFQAASMKLFGINEFAARFPNVLAGIGSLLALYFIGKQWRNRQFGWLWVAAYFGSLLPHLYFRSGIIDPWFNLFIFLSLYAFIRLSEKISRSKLTWALLGGISIGLAILTKGPVAALILGLCILIYWIIKRFQPVPNWKWIGIFGLSALVMVGSWFGLDWYQNGPWFTKTFIEYQIRLLSTEDAGHGGFPGYHFVVLLFGCFPAATLGIRAWFQKIKSGDPDPIDLERWMRILFWVVLILFSLVQSKIVHYSSLCYFPLSFLAASQIQGWIRNGLPIPKLEKYLTLGIGSLWAIACLALPFVGRHPEWIAPLLDKDPFAVANLEALVQWPILTIVPGVFLAVLLWLFMRSSKQTTTSRAILQFFVGTALFLFLALWAFLGRIEQYSQRAIIEFYKEHQEEKAYFHPVGFKSYAPLWYARVEADLPAESKDPNWLFNGTIDRDVYFITKINKESRLSDKPQLQKVWSENGFVVYKRSK